MRYVGLLRGINVGGNRKVEMKRLRVLFESIGFSNVYTYLNSGNIIFESGQDQTNLNQNIELKLKKEFGFKIPTLIKSELDMKKIIEAIPKSWKNDSTHKSDVAFLFPEIDYKSTLDNLPVKKDFITVHYINGAIYWNIDRKNYSKSQINKFIGHKFYQLMTVRSINTARYLAEYK